MLKDAKTLLADHLRALMSAHPRLKDRASVAKAAAISPRSVGYMLQPSSGNPTLANIVAVADVFGVRAWQLLIDVDLEKEKFLQTMVVPHLTPERHQPDESPHTLHEPRRTYKN